MMKIPDDFNTRAEAMWRIISQRVDFRQKNVIDLGCGHGEMLWRSYVAGAKLTIGTEHPDGFWDRELPFIDGAIHFSPIELNNIVSGETTLRINFDIAICFSVLPYLDKPLEFIQWMAETFPICLIEAQYEPEPYNIGVSNDDEMFRLLRDNGFEIAIPLGKTYIEIRDTWRSIFYCTREKKPLGIN